MLTARSIASLPLLLQLLGRLAARTRPRQHQLQRQRQPPMPADKQAQRGRPL
jgi:hypothetical protein